MKKILPILLLLSGLGLAACGSGPSNPSVGNTDPSATLAPVPAEYAGKSNPLGPGGASAGASVFQTNCAPCHGAQGHGDGPAGTALVPPPRNLAELNKIAPDDYLFWRISTGKPGTAMPPWKGVLSDQQIWQVISFIRTLK